MRFFLLFCALVLSFPALAAWEDKPTARLRWLDKITARTATVDVERGETIQYGDLSIRLKSCRAQDPLEGSDSAAFLQIWEDKGGDKPEWVFSGWMFASSPGLSAMDHPIYDVWVLSCTGPGEGKVDAPDEDAREDADKAEEQVEPDAAEEDASEADVESAR